MLLKSKCDIKDKLEGRRFREHYPRLHAPANIRTVKQLLFDMQDLCMMRCQKECVYLQDVSFREHLLATRQSLLAAVEHSDIPFTRLVELANVTPSQAHTPVFQAAVTFKEHAAMARETSDQGISFSPFMIEVSYMSATMAESLCRSALPCLGESAFLLACMTLLTKAFRDGGLLNISDCQLNTLRHSILVQPLLDFLTVIDFLPFRINNIG